MAMNLRTVALATVAVVSSMTAAANADDLILVDLSVVNQITIMGTEGLSSASVTGSDFTGVLLADFYNGNQTTALGVNGGTGNFTTFNDTADNTPSSFRGTNDPGLNIWDFATSTNISVTAGVRAFIGTAVYSLDAGEYADMIAGNMSGTIYMPADTSDDIPSATAIGTWRVIPTPGAASVLGFGLIAAARRRR